ncbi:hypothetical protein PAPYR_9209 [Paratrimastix pyriformis]|uniref:Dynein axonemal light chain 1 n=1 Tax=Paratrimastix pyriformis TaxID=342808 RepID=A0ABQ8UBP7_9EUKA|nr:hypothetical protein PAPYR_9209 [Paratrimastix pyriformis]
MPPMFARSGNKRCFLNDSPGATVCIYMAPDPGWPAWGSENGWKGGDSRIGDTRLWQHAGFRTGRVELYCPKLLHLEVTDYHEGRAPRHHPLQILWRPTVRSVLRSLRLEDDDARYFVNRCVLVCQGWMGGTIWSSINTISNCDFRPAMYIFEAIGDLSANSTISSTTLSLPLVLRIPRRPAGPDSMPFLRSPFTMPNKVSCIQPVGKIVWNLNPAIMRELLKGHDMSKASYPVYVYFDNEQNRWFCLEDLRGLGEYINPNAIKEIRVKSAFAFLLASPLTFNISFSSSDNKLQTLDLQDACPRGFARLKRLYASKNKISRVNVVNHQKLELLDLSNNQIADLPQLEGLRALTELNLSNNVLSGSLEPLREVASSLLKLDLSHNLFDFTCAEFNGAMDVIGAMLHLTDLSMTGNSFYDRIPEETIRNQVALVLGRGKIKTLDGVPIKPIKKGVYTPLTEEQYAAMGTEMSQAPAAPSQPQPAAAASSSGSAPPAGGSGGAAAGAAKAMAAAVSMAASVAQMAGGHAAALAAPRDDVRRVPFSEFQSILGQCFGQEAGAIGAYIVPRSPPPTLIPDVNALTHLHASLCVCASFETLPRHLKDFASLPRGKRELLFTGDPSEAVSDFVNPLTKLVARMRQATSCLALLALLPDSNAGQLCVYHLKRAKSKGTTFAEIVAPALCDVVASRLGETTFAKVDADLLKHYLGTLAQVPSPPAKIAALPYWLDILAAEMERPEPSAAALTLVAVVAHDPSALNKLTNRHIPRRVAALLSQSAAQKGPAITPTRSRLKSRTAGFGGARGFG